MALGRIRGSSLAALTSALRFGPTRALAVGTLREQLGISALQRLPQELRAPLQPSNAPLRARASHERASAELPLPTSSSGPRRVRAFRQAYERGATTPETVVKAAYAAAARLGALAPSRNPLLEEDQAGALSAAAESLERLRTGRARSALEGVPIVVKEELFVRGLSSRVGTGWMAPNPQPADAVLVARLRAAGAIVLGTTPMTEYGLSPLGANAHRTMPRNAHSAKHLAGGSSTGSGVAVALGLVPLAVAADGGGSIRVPAAFNGVFGLKPTYGRLPLTGHGLTGGMSVGHFGPIGVGTEELALMLELGAGFDAGDATTAFAPPLAEGSLHAALRRGVRGLKIGVDDREWAAADPAVAAAGRAALTALEGAGAELVPLQLELAQHAPAMGVVTIGLEASSALRAVRAEHLGELALDTQATLLGLGALGAEDYLDVQRLRTSLRRELQEALAHVDVLALPTTVGTAPAVSDAEAKSGFFDPQAIDRATRYAFLANLSGLPAASVPVGTDSSGLPIGLQLIGDAWDEACVLQVSAELERLGVSQSGSPELLVDLLG